MAIATLFAVLSLARQNGELFGIEAKVGFKIMSTDIHTVKDGRIVRSYHFEDWERAMRKIAGASKNTRANSD